MDNALLYFLVDVDVGCYVERSSCSVPKKNELSLDQQRVKPGVRVLQKEEDRCKTIVALRGGLHIKDLELHNGAVICVTFLSSLLTFPGI